MEYYQTGDVLYVKVESVPKTAEKLQTDLFHKGENHHHKVRGEFEIFKQDDEMFLKCDQQCELFHEEHSTVTIPAGAYQKRIVMEYDHIREESRKVID